METMLSVSPRKRDYEHDVSTGISPSSHTRLGCEKDRLTDTPRVLAARALPCGRGDVDREHEREAVVHVAVAIACELREHERDAVDLHVVAHELRERGGAERDVARAQEEAAGSVFWHPKGWTLYRTVRNYMRARLEAAGYVGVNTPQMVDRALDG